MKISPLKFQTITKTQKTSTNPINFQNNITNGIYDSYRFGAVKDAKSKEIEENIKLVKKFAKITKTNAKSEDILKNISLQIIKINGFKMYTPVDNDKNEKLLFADFDNPEIPTRMERYSFKDGIKLQKSYEFYDDTFKNYKLAVYDEKDTYGGDANLQYIVANGELIYYKCYIPEAKEGLEATFSNDGIMYQDGLFDKDGNMVFSTSQIFLANDRKDTTYTIYNESTDCYETYQYDKKAKKWLKTKEV